MGEKKLESQSWYFGFLSRREVFRHLVQIGDFCVRSSATKGHEESILVVYTEERRHRELVLKYFKNADQHGYGFANLPRTIAFPSIGELVEYFKQNPVLPKGMKLLNPVQRPPMMLREEQLEIDKKKLGQGNYAEVVKGVFIDKDGRIPVAVKQSKTDVIKEFAKLERDEQKKTVRKIKVLMEQMTTEARLLFGVNHDNVIKVYGISCDRLPIQVVVELCPGGSLFDHLLHMKDKIAVDELNIFLLEIARGLRHLQLSKILHRDVAARNCLIGSRGQVVISDFGLSKPYEELKDDDDGIQMAIPWMAPETLSRTPRFSVKSDVYSFGVVVNELYTFGEKPWPDLDVDSIIAVVRQGRKMKPPDNMAENVRNLMNECWSRKPSERPDFVVVVRKLHQIVEEGKIPDPSARSVAHLENVQPVAFNLNDETDFEVVEYSCISEDREEDSSSRRRRGRFNEKERDSSGSTRRRKSQRKRPVNDSGRASAQPPPLPPQPQVLSPLPAAPGSSQNNDSDQDGNVSKEDEEGDSSQAGTKRGTGSTRRRYRKSSGNDQARASTPTGKNGMHKRQSTGSTVRKSGGGHRTTGKRADKEGKSCKPKADKKRE